MAVLDYGKGISIDILKVQKDTVEIEYEDESTERINFVSEVKLKVTHKDKEYYVDCYALDVVEVGDSYVIRVYDTTDGMNFADINWSNEHEISWSDVDSGGNMYDNGLQLEDTEVEEAIMEVLFGEKPLIVAF